MAIITRSNAAQHGSAGMYSSGCRCDVCKAGKAASQRAYMQMKRQAAGQTPQACTLCGLPLARYTTAVRPFHRPCKDSAPKWMKAGLSEPTPKPAPEPKPAPREMHSAVRVAFEDGDYPAFIDAIRSRVTSTESGCWEWQGQMKKGYPELTMGKQRKQVHRLVLEKREGAPLGVLSAHHMCANSKCVNPDHLQPITHRENTAEMLARTSLEARIDELEMALSALAPSHPALHRVSHRALTVAA